MQRGETREDVLEELGGRSRDGAVVNFKEADTWGTIGSLFDWLENSGEFYEDSWGDMKKFVERVFDEINDGNNVVVAPWWRRWP